MIRHSAHLRRCCHVRGSEALATATGPDARGRAAGKRLLATAALDARRLLVERQMDRPPTMAALVHRLGIRRRRLRHALRVLAG
jgi:hypothetical protein